MIMTVNRKEYHKEWKLKNPEYYKEYNNKNKEKRANYSKEWLLKNPEYYKIYNNKNKEKKANSSKKWRLKNKEYVKEFNKEWYLKNIEYVKEYNDKNKKHRSEYLKKKRVNDPIFRMQANMRTAMNAALSGKRKSKSTMTLIGCSVEGLFKHLESCKSWEPWMTRKRYGKNGWDVDHIVPISKWNANCPLQFALCWDKSNLQPMEHIANIKKGAK